MNKQKNNSLITSGIISYVTIAVTIVTGIIYTPLLIKTIGTSDYALFTLATTFISFFLLDFGISAAVTRFISVYKSKGKYKQINEFIGLVIKIFISIDTIILLILLCGYFFIGDIFTQLSSIEVGKFKTIYIIISTYSILSFLFMPLNGILTAYEEFVFLKVVDLVQKLLTFVLLIISIIIYPNLYLIVLINSFSNLFSIIFKSIYINKKLDIQPDYKASNKEMMKVLLKFSVWSTIILICQRLMMNFAPTILGRYSGTEEIAIFSIGSSIEGYFFLFSNALNSLFLPSVSKLIYTNKNHDDDKEAELLTLMTRIGRIQLIISGALFVIFIVVGKEFLLLWLGSGFEQSYYIILLLVLPGVVTYTQTIAYNYLSVINEIKYRAISFISSALISLLLSFILVGKYGAIGVAFGISIGIVFGQIILLNIFLVHKFKLNIKNFFKDTHLLLFPALAVSFLIIYFINQYMGEHGIVFMCFKILLFLIIYVLSIVIFGLSKNEKKYIMGRIVK